MHPDIEQTTIEIHTRFGPAQWPVWRYRELAVAEYDGNFAIVYVPEGNCLPYLFPSLEVACSAMVELDKLSNNWLDLSDEDKAAIERRAEQLFQFAMTRVEPNSYVPPEKRNGYN